MQILIIISMIAGGFITGKLLKCSRNRYFQSMVTALIWLLLFLLGAEAGSNREVVSNFTTMGAEAFVITVAGLAGSILCAWILWRVIRCGTDKTGK